MTVFFDITRYFITVDREVTAVIMNHTGGADIYLVKLTLPRIRHIENYCRGVRQPELKMLTGSRAQKPLQHVNLKAYCSHNFTHKTALQYLFDSDALMTALYDGVVSMLYKDFDNPDALVSKFLEAVVRSSCRSSPSRFLRPVHHGKITLLHLNISSQLSSVKWHSVPGTGDNSSDLTCACVIEPGTTMSRIVSPRSTHQCGPV